MIGMSICVYRLEIKVLSPYTMQYFNKTRQTVMLMQNNRLTSSNIYTDHH